MSLNLLRSIMEKDKKLLDIVRDKIRIKDVDFGFNKLYIWDSKSLKT